MKSRNIAKHKLWSPEDRETLQKRLHENFTLDGLAKEFRKTKWSVLMEVRDIAGLEKKAIGGDDVLEDIELPLDDLADDSWSE